MYIYVYVHVYFIMFHVFQKHVMRSGLSFFPFCIAIIQRGTEVSSRTMVKLSCSNELEGEISF